MMYSPSFTAIVSTLAAVAALLALAMVVRRQGTQPPASRLEELEDEVRALRQEVDNLSAVNKMIIQMNGDLTRQLAQREEDFRSASMEANMLRQKAIALGIPLR